MNGKPARTALGAAFLILAAALPAAAGEEAAGAFTPQIKEITVFKDGHALILREGEGTPADGMLATTVVPEALLGAFWILTPKDAPRPQAISAAWRDGEREVPCLTVAEILAANPGKAAALTVGSLEKPEVLRGTLLPRPEYKKEETRLEAESQPAWDRWGRHVPAREASRTEETTVQGEIIGLKREDGGVVFLRLADVRQVEVSRDPVLTRKEKRRERVLRFQFAKDAKGPVRLALVTIERGVRWIPEYRIEEAAGGKEAAVRLQATLVNDVADLKEAKVHLVVGVPKFDLGGTLSPLSLAEVPRRLSAFFPPAGGAGSMGAWASQRYDNRNVGQVVMPTGEEGAAALIALPEGAAGAGATERAADLFVYNLEAPVTLAPGERSTATLWEAPLPAQEVYSWVSDPLPPEEMWRHLGGGERQRELALRLAEPKVRRVLRLTNNRPLPLTTGPALLFAGERIVGQETLTYTSPGNSVDVPLSVAVDVNSAVSGSEIGRDNNFAKIDGTNFTRVRLKGELKLMNFGKEKVAVKVSRYVAGKVTKAGAEGKITTLDWTEFTRRLAARAPGDSGHWGDWGDLPGWWKRTAGLGLVEWTAVLEPGKAQVLEYEWEYLVPQ